MVMVGQFVRSEVTEFRLVMLEPAPIFFLSAVQVGTAKNGRFHAHLQEFRADLNHQSLQDGAADRRRGWSNRLRQAGQLKTRVSGFAREIKNVIGQFKQPFRTVSCRNLP